LHKYYEFFHLLAKTTEVRHAVSLFCKPNQ
jgi:hypothetical protein